LGTGWHRCQVTAKATHVSGDEEDRELRDRIRADALFALSTIPRRRLEMFESEYLIIKNARNEGIFWEEIAGALGLQSPQAAYKRFRNLRELLSMLNRDPLPAVMAPGEDPPSVPGFTPGGKVWPREGPMVLQDAPQTVIATCRHPVAGDWVWLDDGRCGFRSFAAAHWTTEEPGDDEKAARNERRGRRAAENAELPDFPIPPERLRT